MKKTSIVFLALALSTAVQINSGLAMEEDQSRELSTKNISEYRKLSYKKLRKLGANDAPLPEKIKTSLSILEKYEDRINVKRLWKKSAKKVIKRGEKLEKDLDWLCQGSWKEGEEFKSYKDLLALDTFGRHFPDKMLFVYSRC